MMQLELFPLSERWYLGHSRYDFSTLYLAFRHERLTIVNALRVLPPWAIQKLGGTSIWSSDTERDFLYTHLFDCESGSWSSIKSLGESQTRIMSVEYMYREERKCMVQL